MRIDLHQVPPDALATVIRTFAASPMITITPQMRIMVAMTPVDGRKGIDSLTRLCREKLNDDPFSGCLFLVIPGHPAGRP